MGAACPLDFRGMNRSEIVGFTPSTPAQSGPYMDPSKLLRGEGAALSY